MSNNAQGLLLAELIGLQFPAGFTEEESWGKSVMLIRAARTGLYVSSSLGCCRMQISDLCRHTLALGTHLKIHPSSYWDEWYCSAVLLVAQV